MAKKNRVDLNAVIQANLPDNTIDFITPALDREVEIDEVDSCFNLEDDTAVDVNYNPSTPLDWDVTIPTEVKAGLDQAAQRVRLLEGFPSANMAYVDSIKGSDTVGEFELGNPLRPFKTIPAALAALPTNNIYIKVIAGVYGTVGTPMGIGINSRNNVVLDIQGSVLNGFITLNSASTNVVLITYGSVFNSTSSIYGSINGSVNILGGTFNLNVAGSFPNFKNNTNRSSLVKDVIATTNSNFNVYQYYEGTFQNCKFLKTGGAGGGNVQLDGSSTVGLEFINCKFESESFFYVTSSGGNNIATFRDCEAVCDTVDGMYGITTNGFHGFFYNCYIKNISGCVLNITEASNVVKFEGCTLEGFTDCIDLSDLNTGGGRVAGTDNVFKDCLLYAGSGDIFLEPVSYSASDFGEVLSINNTYNKTQPTVLKITEHSAFVDANLQKF